MQSDERLKRIEQVTDVPLLILALVMVPLLLAPLILDLSHPAENALLAADWTIWAFFAVDFAVKLAVAPRRIEYARGHWLEAAMVVLPFLRPLRALRLLRVARLLTVVGLNAQIIRDILSSRGTQFVAAMVSLIAVAGAGLVLAVENNADGANITSFGDALWWSVTTMTTVGYGDHFPTTATGRGIAVALMLFGIATLSALTAVIAAYLVREEPAGDDVTLAEIRDEVLALRAEVAALRSAQLDQG